MADFAALQIRLDAQTAAFEKGMKQATNSLQRMEARSKQTNSTLGRMETSFKRVGASVKLFAASLAGAFTVGQVKNAIEYGDALAKTSTKIGLNVEVLQELRFAAERSGIATTALDTGMQRFSRRLGEAANGTGVLYKEINKLNIPLKTADGTMRSTEAILGDYANAMQNAGSEQERLRLAVAAFDTEGAGMVNMLGDGVDGLNKLRSAAREAGAIMDSNLTATAENINDKWDTLTTQIGVKFKSALISAAKATLEVFNVFTDLAGTQERIIELENEILTLEVKIGNARNNSRTVANDRKLLESKREELAALREQEAAYSRRQLALDNAGKANATFTESTEKATEALKEQLKVMDALLDDAISMQQEMERESDRQDELAEKYKDALDPLREYSRELKVLTDLKNSGRLTIDEYMKSIEMLDDKFEKLGEDAKAAGKTLSTALGVALGNELSNLVDGIFDVDKSFKDWATSALTSIAKVIFQVKLLNPLLKDMQNSMSGGGGLGGFFGSLFGFSHGGAFNQLALPHGVYSSPTKFGFGNQLKPFASGGILGEAGPEAVLPLTRVNGRLGVESSGGVNVIVNNNTSDKITVNERNGANGMRELEIMVDQRVQRTFANGSMDRLMGNLYGTRRIGK